MTDLNMILLAKTAEDAVNDLREALSERDQLRTDRNQLLVELGVALTERDRYKAERDEAVVALKAWRKAVANGVDSQPEPWSTAWSLTDTIIAKIEGAR